jgi:hypothetical protein
MQPFTLDPRDLGQFSDLIGAVVTEEVAVGGRRLFHKGHRLEEGDLGRLVELERPVHAVRLDPDEVHEDEAGRRLAGLIAGEHLAIRGPVQSRYNLVAETKGLLRVDAGTVLALNRLPGIAVFTLPDRLPVLPGKIVTGAKITPVAVPEAVLLEAAALVREGPPVVRVEEFRSLLVGVVTTEGLTGRVRERFRETVERKVGWYGGRLLRFEEPPSDERAVGAAIAGLLEDGAELVLAGGGNTIDPLDATLRALGPLGAEMVRFGAPAHPGSMFWLAYRGPVPIFNLASCSMYSKATVADLILPWIMAGERVSGDDLAGLGYGGLLDRGMGFRFPAYEAAGSEEAGEGEE